MAQSGIRGGKWILTLLIMTAISVVTGGGFGLVVASSVERAVEARVKAEAQKEVPATPYSGDIVLKALAPVVTNLASSDDAWVRLESALVMNSTDGASDVLAGEIRQDILAYLRTVSLAQIQGPSGLLHLRADLNERLQIRSKDAVKELVIQALIVQ
jgi:flagellar FliL protein